MTADDFTANVTPLTAPIDAEGYMRVLLDRQAAWEAAHGGRQTWTRPLLEWFIAAGDEPWVRLPDTASTPKRQTKPRVYRSAASIRAELDKVQAEMERVAGTGPDDGAVVNLSPVARSRAARNAGRRRFAQLDRDLERYASLGRRRAALAGRLAAAEARELESPDGDHSTAATRAFR